MDISPPGCGIREAISRVSHILNLSEVLFMRISTNGFPTTLLGAGLIVMLAVVCGIAGAIPGQSAGHDSTGKTGKNTNSVSRGEYIVNDVAVCSQCHTPRDSEGQFIRSRWLEGSPVWFQPAAPQKNWPLQAPRLAGSMPASEAAMVRLLTTGVWTNGEELRPPMPQFRMSREDAEAVVAYLKSLNPEAQH